MDEKNLSSTDPSLLNRFEKQTLSFNDVLDEKQQKLVRELKDWIERMYTFRNDSTIQLHTSKFALFFDFDKDESLQALVLENTKDNRYTDRDEILMKCKESLISVLSSDGVLRIERSALEREEIVMLKDIYFCQQFHDNLYDYFESLFNIKNTTGGDLVIVNTFSDLNTDIISCLGELTSCQIYKLSIFKTESQLSDRVKDFFFKSDDQILMIQCEATITNSRYIKLTKSIIEKYRNEFLINRRPHNNSTKIVCLINHIKRDYEQNLISNFIPEWKQITIESLEQCDIPLNKLYDKSLYEILNSKIFRKLIISSMPFEKFLKDKLGWCFSRIKYPISNENYIR